MIGGVIMIGGIGYGAYGSYNAYGTLNGYDKYGAISAPGKEQDSAGVTAMKKAGAVECETCASRKYQDGSNEGDVSFKAPGHIDPGASAAVVMSHEQEHVANAYEKAEKGNGQVIRASVRLETAVCPECGRSYISGGVTNTMIKYNESNPYSKVAKAQDATKLIGRKIDYAV